MRKKLYDVHLTEEERAQLLACVNRGKQSARVFTRARILLLADEQRTDEEIAELLNVSMGTVFRIRKRYCQEGLETALHDRPRSGDPLKSMADSKPTSPPWRVQSRRKAGRDGRCAS